MSDPELGAGGVTPVHALALDVGGTGIKAGLVTAPAS